MLTDFEIKCLYTKHFEHSRLLYSEGSIVLHTKWLWIILLLKAGSRAMADLHIMLVAGLSEHIVF